MKNIDINQIKIGGAKKKNGHKPNCGCHICENIKNKAKRGGYEEEQQIEIEKMNGGSKKKNGHRINCKCPICINMKNATRTKYKKKNRITKNKKGGENTTYLTQDINNSKTEEKANDNDYDELESIIGGNTRKTKKKNIRKTRRIKRGNKYNI